MLIYSMVPVDMCRNCMRNALFWYEFLCDGLHPLPFPSLLFLIIIVLLLLLLLLLHLLILLFLFLNCHHPFSLSSFNIFMLSFCIYDFLSIRSFPICFFLSLSISFYMSLVAPLFSLPSPSLHSPSPLPPQFQLSRRE